jgi:hypothetical protein
MSLTCGRIVTRDAAQQRMRGPSIFAERERFFWSLAIAVLAFAYSVQLFIATRHLLPLTPDTAEYADIARSLVRGTGYAVNSVYIHAGLRSGPVRHAPELHGLLQPFLVAPLFALFGAHGVLMRVPTLAFASLSAILVFEGGRRLFGTFAGVVAACVLLSGSGTAFMAYAGPDDVGHGLFAASALLVFVRALPRGDRHRLLLSGVLLGLATLEKYSGVVLLAVLVVTVLADRDARRRFRLRDWGLASLPTFLAFVLYVLRNVASHGTPGFSFTALDWLAKVDARAYFAYYEVAPRTLEVLAELGPARVLGLVADQFSSLWVVALGRPVVFIGGPIALVLLRQERTFVRVALLYSLVMVFVVCVAYHVEARYLFGLEQMYCVAVGGAAALLSKRFLPRYERWMAGACYLLAFWLGASGIAAFVQAIAPPGRNLAPCAGAIEFLRTRTDPDARILTANPWFVTWDADRAAIAAPTNGAEAVITVARHYRTTWMFHGSDAIWGNALGEVVGADSALRPAPAYVDPRCAVYRLQAIH